MNNNIPFPSGEEKAASVSYILEKGVPRPRGLASLGDMSAALGIRGLFFGVEDSLLLALLCAAAMLALSAAYAQARPERLCLILFSVSPAAYALLQLLTGWKERLSGTYEQKMACRYTIREVNALRMLCFSGVSVILSVLLGVGFSRLRVCVLPLWRLLGLSFAALFLYASLSMAALLLGRGPGRRLIAPGAWLAVTGLLAALGAEAERFLLNLPPAVSLVAAAGAAALYLSLLSKYCFTREKGALVHAVC